MMPTKIFSADGGALVECHDTKEYYNGIVTEGGYSSGEGLWCSVRLFNADREMSFRINDTGVYDKILAAYLTKETIGVVLYD